MTTTKKRNGGAQPRAHAVRLFALVDHALASDKGLWPSHFTKDNGCSTDTLVRYITDLTAKGKKLICTHGVWRYDSGESRLFTDECLKLFAE